jgi:hypothetical protein
VKKTTFTRHRALLYIQGDLTTFLMKNAIYLARNTIFGNQEESNIYTWLDTNYAKGIQDIHNLSNAGLEEWCKKNYNIDITVT